MTNIDEIFVEETIRFFCSWSGGKGSCLALYRMVNRGHVCASLLTMLDDAGEYSSFHGLRSEAMRAQARSMNLPIMMARSLWNGYEERFADSAKLLHRGSASHAVFGDVLRPDGKEWIGNVCVDCGLVAHMPLWRREPSHLVREVLAAGFRFIVVAIDKSRVPTRFLGREYDMELVKDLEAMGIDPSGEGDEFRTFAFDGPLFRYPIEFWKGEPKDDGHRQVLTIHVSLLIGTSQ